MMCSAIAKNRKLGIKILMGLVVIHGSPQAKGFCSGTQDFFDEKKLSDILCDKALMQDGDARSLEKYYNLPIFWLDQDHSFYFKMSGLDISVVANFIDFPK